MSVETEVLFSGCPGGFGQLQNREQQRRSRRPSSGSLIFEVGRGEREDRHGHAEALSLRGMKFSQRQHGTDDSIAGLGLGTKKIASKAGEGAKGKRGRDAAWRMRSGDMQGSGPHLEKIKSPRREIGRTVRGVEALKLGPLVKLRRGTSEGYQGYPTRKGRDQEATAAFVLWAWQCAHEGGSVRWQEEEFHWDNLVGRSWWLWNWAAGLLRAEGIDDQPFIGDGSTRFGGMTRAETAKEDRGRIQTRKREAQPHQKEWSYRGFLLPLWVNAECVVTEWLIAPQSLMFVVHCFGDPNGGMVPRLGRVIGDGCGRKMISMKARKRS